MASNQYPRVMIDVFRIDRAQLPAGSNLSNPTCMEVRLCQISKLQDNNPSSRLPTQPVMRKQPKNSDSYAADFGSLTNPRFQSSPQRWLIDLCSYYLVCCWSRFALFIKYQNYTRGQLTRKNISHYTPLPSCHIPSLGIMLSQ